MSSSTGVGSPDFVMPDKKNVGKTAILHDIGGKGEVLG